MKLVNIGCGAHYHKDWINIDVYSDSEDVIEYDLTKGLPFETNSIDVCYSSHVLEHLRNEEADFFINEQRRVLKRGGIIRIVVPDLETICRNYLEFFDKVSNGDLAYEFKYDYSLIELFDQVSREKSGGEMIQIWNENRHNEENFKYIIKRSGLEATSFLTKYESKGGDRRLRVFSKRLFKRIINKLGFSFSKSVVRAFLGKNGERSFQEGYFRNLGQIHRVMYDRFKLKRLLERHGFTNVSICDSNRSSIQNFRTYNLDSVNGEIRKPDSLYMEARKPI